MEINDESDDSVDLPSVKFTKSSSGNNSDDSNDKYV